MANRLSVCLLVRDEESNLERALGSVAGLADEVVVVDTGSTDRTVAVAEALGARVEVIDWDDDFAAGRNRALELATGDWVLWLNPDEELLPESGPALRAALEADDVFAFAVRVRHVARAGRLDEAVETTDVRLFRRRPGLRYVGRAHPSFPAERLEAEAREGRRLELGEVVLRRHAYLSVPTEPKLRWAARLLERELADRPGQLPYLIEYGQTLLRLGEPRGHAVMAEALARVLPGRTSPTAPSPDVQVLLEYALTTPPERHGAPLSPGEAADLALRWFPASPPLLWAVAEHLFRRGDLARAAVLLERLLQLGRAGTYDRSRAFDPGLLGASTLRNLAECYRGLGRRDRAVACLRDLLDDERYRDEAARRLQDLGPDPTGSTGAP